MPTPALTSRVKDVVAPVVSAAGLFLEAVEVAPAGRRTVVRVVLDLDTEPGGLDLDTLADVSREVADALDAADVVPGEYTLEVSTPGVERPLTEPRHFLRARGRLVRLVRRDGGTLTGRLADVDGEELVLAVEAPVAKGARRRAPIDARVPLADVLSGHVEVELSRVDELGPDDEAQDDADDDNFDTEA